MDPKVETTNLDNGLAVTTVALPHLHTAVCALYLKVGARFESPADNGLAVTTVALPHLQTTVSLWTLQLDSELIYNGDAGATELERNQAVAVGGRFDDDHVSEL